MRQIYPYMSVQEISVLIPWVTCWKRLTSWLFFVMYNCVFVTFPCDILGQVWYLIVSIHDLCNLSYIEMVFVLILNATN